jgi:hypothetical protein
MAHPQKTDQTSRLADHNFAPRTPFCGIESPHGDLHRLLLQAIWLLGLVYSAENRQRGGDSDEAAAFAHTGSEPGEDGRDSCAPHSYTAATISIDDLDRL